MRKILPALLVCGFLFVAARAFATEPAADAILGQWFTEDDESIVEIYKAGSCYSGKIVWLKEPKNSDGTEKVDSNNADESKRGRKVMGMDIVTGFKYDGKSAWNSGKIYDPNNGKTYSCNAKLDKEKLNIRGFIGVAVLGRTTVWRRAEGNLAAARE
jgi:uncharacterized protein (DUF2147 family)